MQERAADFNCFFADVGKNTYDTSQQVLREYHSIISQDCIPDLDVIYQFRPQPVNVSTVVLTIKHLTETKATGSDGLPRSFITDALCVIALYITCIINAFIVTGVVPTAWKHALVVPVHKKGDVNNVNNHRSISILPVL